MKKVSSIKRVAMHVGLIALLAGLCVTRGESQDPKLKPTFGSVDLKAGFPKDPHVVKVIAGGDIQTKLGGVTQYVANEPDFRLNYTAGNFALTIYAESKADTTLLIKLPDGKWVADDDSGGELNPLLKFEKPQSGQYNIWVGTFGKDNAPAVLKITELK